MDCLPHYCCHTRTLHRLPYSTGRRKGKGIKNLVALAQSEAGEPERLYKAVAVVADGVDEDIAYVVDILRYHIQAASEPNQLSICVNKANYTHDMIQRTGKFTVSVLSQKAQFELFKHFGFQSGRDTNKFEAFEQCARGTNGIYYITEGTPTAPSARSAPIRSPSGWMPGASPPPPAVNGRPAL